MTGTIKIILSLFLFFAFINFSSAQVKNKEENKVPIIIEADSFEYDNKQKIAVYKDNVVVRKGDFTLWADLMHIYFDKNSKIKKIIAEGKVRFKKGLYSGKSEKAIYEADKEIIKLIGNAKVKKENNVLEGDEIEYFMNEDKTVVIGKSKKVRTIIIPEEVKEKGK